MSLNPQVEDEKKKPDSIGTGIGKEIKIKSNAYLVKNLVDYNKDGFFQGFRI